ncbi:MAG: hypothetical protein R3C14_13675 [Caldilineaceae bacterium]
MKNSTASQPFLQAYSTSFRLHAHLLLAWGYERAKSQFGSEDEEEISDILYQNIQHLLYLEQQRWMANYAVKNEDPISGGARKGKNRREIDLIIEFTGRGRPQYVFEAKVLNWSKVHQRTSHYTDKDNGMGRFLTGEYANYTARFPEVGMLGYVLSDSIEDWKQRLTTAIERKKDPLQLCRSQENIVICDAILYEWISEHIRDSADLPIIIHHILLDCR